MLCCASLKYDTILVILRPLGVTTGYCGSPALGADGREMRRPQGLPLELTEKGRQTGVTHSHRHPEGQTAADETPEGIGRSERLPHKLLENRGQELTASGWGGGLPNREDLCRGPEKGKHEDRTRRGAGAARKPELPGCGVSTGRGCKAGLATLDPCLCRAQESH